MMCNAFDFIHNEATNIVKEYETNDPFILIHAKDIILKYVYDFTDLKGFYTNKDGYRYIRINGNLDSIMKRVVAAHELGHDVLHKALAADFPMQNIALFSNNLKIERQANDFAANLLLSDELVWNEFKNGELETENSSVTIYPKQLLYYKFSNMKKRGFKIPDRVISYLEAT